MPVELRKRPPPKETATPPPTAKRSSNPVKKFAEKAKEAVSGAKKSANGTTTASAPAAAAEDPTPTSAPVAPAKNGSASSKIAVGETVDLEGFGGTVQTHDGQDTTLKQLVEKSLAGVVIFTYPRASTPGCMYFPLSVRGFLMH